MASNKAAYSCNMAYMIKSVRTWLGNGKDPQSAERIREIYQAINDLQFVGTSRTGDYLFTNAPQVSCCGKCSH